MRDHLAALLDDFREFDRQIAVVLHRGNRRRATSYGELARMAGRFAALLEERGIVEGDRVVLWAENSAEWIATFYGCMLRGVLAVPLDAYGAADFAARVCADVQPRLIVGDSLLLHQLPDAWPRLQFEDWPGALSDNEAGPLPGISAATPLQILFTSGTTGDPKGIVHTHGNVLASVRPIADGAKPYLRYERPFHPLRFFDTLPLSHVFGQMMGLWIPPIFAAQVHFDSRLVAPRIVETIRRERISVLAAVPRVMGMLKTHLETTHSALAGEIARSQGIRAWKRWWRFRKIHSAFGFKFWALISGGGALPGPLEQFWNALGFVVVQGYGMTETTALITLNHPFHVARGSIGKPLPGREVKLGPDGEVLVRGPMISTSTWQAGRIRQRESEWLATGDLAESQTGGDMRFLGRKSEVIVTASGVNLHPEDLEAVIEQEPGVTACAVVAMETPSGIEPCAVMALRGDAHRAASAIEHANARLADYQRVRRWMLWPEPDLPRTSTGKVKRKAVAAWVADAQAPSANPSSASSAADHDWLLALIGQISGETPHGRGDPLRLTEDLHLDSLGRVQLAAAIEERLGLATESGLLERVETLGELRKFVQSETAAEPASAAHVASSNGNPRPQSPSLPAEAAGRSSAIYSSWPWMRLFQWKRAAFIEIVMRPLVWLLGAPRVTRTGPLDFSAPLLIVANHVTAYDAPLLMYALPGHMRRHIAIAMSGQMLDDFLHFRSPESGRYFPFGPAAWFLATLYFNVFPLPRRRGFQASFAHAGAAMDRGYHVMVFPEGTRSPDGRLAPFRSGIGMLARQSGAAVLPMAIRGAGELKVNRRWLRTGKLEVRVGQPIAFAPDVSESEITSRLHAEVEELLAR